MNAEVIGTVAGQALDLEHDPGQRASLEAALPAFVAGQRWFAGRDRPIDAARIVFALRDDPGQCWLLIVTVTQGERETRYFLPAWAEPGVDGIAIVDAALSPVGAKALVDVVTGARTLRGVDVLLTSTRHADRECDGEARPLGAEQSNTSIRIGEDCILKVLRQLQPGVNPDVELTAWLSDRGFAHVAAVIAAARIEGAVSADVLILQDFVPNQGDGWTWALDAARRESSCASDESVAAARDLGQVIGEMHALFATAGGEGVTPRPAGAADMASLAADIRREARATADVIASQDPILGARLRTYEPALNGDAGGLLTRIHGDLHLGQVLRANSGSWTVIDFEGEPARPLRERRALQSPLTDVAGMLRSFDYAAAMGCDDSALATGWAWQMRQAFLAGYVEGIGDAAHSLLPTGWEAPGGLLGLLVLRKALYEVRYEAASRPSWLWVPLEAVRAMVTGNDD